MKIKLQSFTSPINSYELDKQARTCTCPAYTPGDLCKHLNAIGVYRQQFRKPSSRPNFSQALSALVKSIRIRNLEEAAYWLHYCLEFDKRLPGSHFRTVRRLLIGSAEDGHSIAVMEKVAENFPALLHKEVAFERVLAELIRICKIPNWWHPDSGGQDYIHCGLLASRINLYRSHPIALLDCLEGLEIAIRDHRKVDVLAWTMTANQIDTKAGKVLAQKLNQTAIEYQNDHAKRLTDLYLRNAKPLSGDENFLCQAAWLLAGGISPVLDHIETVTLGEIRSLQETIQPTIARPVPGWGCDGVHCFGSDIRYAGMWDRMFAVCQQFNHYGRLNPDDPWLEEVFYSVEGLRIA